MGKNVNDGFVFSVYTEYTMVEPKLKTGYRYENQFWNPGFTNGVS